MVQEIAGIGGASDTFGQVTVAVLAGNMLAPKQARCNWEILGKISWYQLGHLRFL